MADFREQGLDKIVQSSIKNENTRAIFYEIVSARKNAISRAEIAKKTELSLMTVGKVADSLIARGVVSQAKPATGNAGRRAGLLTVSDSLFMLIADVSGEIFRASVFTLTLDEIDSLTYAYNDSLFPEDNLTLFFRETASLLMKHLREKTMIGSAISVSGYYDAESDAVSGEGSRLEGAKIASTMRASLGFSPDKIMNKTDAAASSLVSEPGVRRSPSALAILLGDSISGRLITNGKLFPARSDFSALISPDGSRLSSVFSGAVSAPINEEKARELAATLLLAIEPLIRVLCPTHVFICSENKMLGAAFETALEDISKNLRTDASILFEASKESRCSLGIAELLLAEKINEII